VKNVSKNLQQFQAKHPHSLIAVVEQESILFIGIELWRFSRQEF
jgi:hypothetical protein